MTPSILLQVEGLKVHFPVRAGVLRRAKESCKAVDGVSLELKAGETLGVVGESGCGKTTLGKALVRLLRPTSGHVLFEGQDLAGLNGRQMKPIRRHLQMVFQDPAESLNSRHTIGTILEEPLIIHGLGESQARLRRVDELLSVVGLPKDAKNRYPFEFSGGQRQRIGIARALALNPKLIICDEPVSALDVSIQSQVLNLLIDLQRELGLSYLFIAHNLAVVRHVSDRIAVMYLGKIVELAGAEELCSNPRHPYTQALIAAVPEPDPKRHRQRAAVKGDIPSPINPPPGCPFHPRCPIATDFCKTNVPPLRNLSAPGQPPHMGSCHYA